MDDRSHEIELLPALPAQWQDGSIEGLHVRGDAVLEMRWKAGKIVSLKVDPQSDGAIRLIPPPGQAVLASSPRQGDWQAREKTVQSA